MEQELAGGQNDDRHGEVMKRKANKSVQWHIAETEQNGRTDMDPVKFFNEHMLCFEHSSRS